MAKWLAATAVLELSMRSASRSAPTASIAVEHETEDDAWRRPACVNEGIQWISLTV